PSGKGPRIGLVEIEGLIINSEKTVKQLDRFARRDDIEALLLRIDSPGGTVAASQEIYAKVRKIREAGEKPVIVSMGTVAASGGYYIAMGADSIMANPGTATGSIGVIMDYPVAEDLLGKLGLQMEVVKSAALKDAGSPYRQPTDADRQVFQGIIDDLHAQFVEVVAEERGLSTAAAQQLATGEVFTGRQALALKLVDLLGSYEDAVELAGALTGDDKRPVIIKPVERKRLSLWELLTGTEQTSFWSPLFLPQYRMR
ncbi:MAG: signal peptide peptidase SppA, partial [Candidatus Marinimicrobia bacterium]|nr:signal peptide peptidase SppA [Candidatus Neomarinimicrobiota bacterium]